MFDFATGSHQSPQVSPNIIRNPPYKVLYIWPLEPHRVDATGKIGGGGAPGSRVLNGGRFGGGGAPGSRVLGGGRFNKLGLPRNPFANNRCWRGRCWKVRVRWTDQNGTALTSELDVIHDAYQSKFTNCSFLQWAMRRNRLAIDPRRCYFFRFNNH